MDWVAYMLRCADGTLYTGVTNDLDRRVSAHQKGVGARYTRSRRPVELVLQESVAGRGAALKREAEIRRLTRAQKLELIARAEDDVAARRQVLGQQRGAGPVAEPADRSPRRELAGAES